MFSQPAGQTVVRLSLGAGSCALSAQFLRRSQARARKPGASLFAGCAIGAARTRSGLRTACTAGYFQGRNKATGDTEEDTFAPARVASIAITLDVHRFLVRESQRRDLQYLCSNYFAPLRPQHFSEFDEMLCYFKDE